MMEKMVTRNRVGRVGKWFRDRREIGKVKGQEMGRT